MRIEMVSGFLLPAGVWLIVSSGLPLQAQRRLATATLLALAVSLLSYVAFGFALMYGGIGAVVPDFARVLNAPIAVVGAQDTWIFAGATGFLVDVTAQPAVLSLFIGALPLMLTCAVLVAGVLAQRARTTAMLVLVALTAGVALPLAGCWLWANGWLSVLGAMDLGKLSVVGLAAGGAGLAWLRSTPRRTFAMEPELPEAHLPARAVGGVLLVLAGMAGILIPLDADAALRQFMNTGIAVAFAIIVAGAYTAFTTRNADTLSASRAMLAAIFMSSAGAATLPNGWMVAIGVGCGLLATVGYFWVNEKRLLNDESAIVTSVLLPAAAGVLITGLFTGAATLIAQVIALGAIVLVGYIPARILLWVAAIVRWPVLAAQIAIATPPATITPAQAAMPESVATEAVSTEPAAAEAASLAMSNDAVATPPVAVDQKPRDLMSWLRRKSPADQSPRQPRKVAYPYRMGGRRMTSRPIAGDTSPVDSTPSIDAS
jgi:Amt family ammonium transporter